MASKAWKKRLVAQADLMDLNEKLKEMGKKIVFTAFLWRNRLLLFPLRKMMKHVL
jgi:hypothetical protein